MVKSKNEGRKIMIKTKVKRNFKSQKAITLIALVAAIIVLLILAGITVVTITGDNGLIKNARESKRTSRDR